MEGYALAEIFDYGLVVVHDRNNWIEMPDLHVLAVSDELYFDLAVHKANADFIEITVFNAWAFTKIYRRLALAQVALLRPSADIWVVNSFWSPAISEGYLENESKIEKFEKHRTIL